MDAIILSIGSELALGETIDTNSAWLAQRLAEIGVGVLRHVTVGDDIEPIRRQIEQACGEADVVLITGGLGPTADDLTRQALAAAMGVELVLRPEWVEKIRSFFACRGRSMPQANAIQAQFPAGSEPIENTCGTAPGIRASLGRSMVFAMPGVPREMREMFERDVRPMLAERTGGAVLIATVLNCFGAGESDIGQQIDDLMQRGRNPTVGTTAKQGVIGVRIHSRGRSAAEARKLLEATEQEVRRRLGTLIYGRDSETLSDAVARLLVEGGKTVSVAESCTGGLIAKRLTDVPGSSRYFRAGLVTYANEAKTMWLGVPADLIAGHGAVSEPVARAMAEACRRLNATDYAIGVTGIAGPEGGTADKPVGLVFISLADAAGCRVTRHLFGDFLNRGEIRERAASTAMNLLRLRLMARGGQACSA
jgi:nicotinamide-nucleotide amidase